MDILLTPGLWLEGSSWDAVRPTLDAASHRTHPLTLPGKQSWDAQPDALAATILEAARPRS